MAVEITYEGDQFERQTSDLNSDEEVIQRMINKDLFPNLEWMTNLKKLVLIKYGHLLPGKDGSVRSLLLDNLCAFIFTEERAPSLECVWVEDFLLATSLSPHWEKAPQKSRTMKVMTEICISIYPSLMFI